MRAHSEVYVAFDTARRKHAVAIVEGERGGELRFLGEIEDRPGVIERLIKKLARTLYPERPSQPSIAPKRRSAN